MSPKSVACVVALTSLAMIAFAGNSLLCRIALEQTTIDAASFTTIRLVSGALVLWLIIWFREGGAGGAGNWISACALFVYAGGFSFAYVTLQAGTGALLLFGAVQATMIGYGIWGGERLRRTQATGLAMAFGGLIVLFSPGISAPPFFGSLLMLVAGVAWGVYSLRGKSGGDPTRVTAGNFLRAVPISLGLSATMLGDVSLDIVGIAYAIASGTLASTPPPRP